MHVSLPKMILGDVQLNRHILYDVSPDYLSRLMEKRGLNTRIKRNNGW